MKRNIGDKLLNTRLVLWLLVVVGAVLRVASMFGPLTHDELSAICRLGYGSLGELVENAVKLTDVHPAGVQVFLWLWCGVFGTSAFAVRLPFVLMGIASIPLVYAVAKRWFGQWPALLPAAVMAVSQYTVYYSVMARPYMPGLFLMLCALYFWTRLVLDKQYRLLFLALFALCEALCAYTQYFCLLSALLLALAGLLFVDRRHLLHYLAACAAAVLLFLPHLGVTLYQLLEEKGVGGWLGKPTPSFPLHYFRYLSHHSLVVAAVAFACYLLVFSLSDLRRNRKLVVVSLVVWVLPLAIGYLYSVAVNPLLQFSSLIFVFPFLLLAFAGAVDSSGRHARLALLLGVFCVAMVLSLVLTRKHFQMLEREWIEIAAQEERVAIDRYGADCVEAMLDVAIDKVQYYDSSLYSLPRSAISDCATFDSFLSASQADYLLCGGIHDPKLLDVAASHFPHLLRYRNCVVTEVLLLGRYPDSDEVNLAAMATPVKCLPLSRFDGEFCELLDTSLAAISESRFVCLNSQFSFLLPDSLEGNLRLVAETHVGRHCVDWREVNVNGFCHRHGDTCSVNLPVRLECWVKHRSTLPRTRLKVYLWNPDADTLTVPLGCNISLYPTNPFIYSVLEEI